jgi:hypothetical protein
MLECTNSVLAKKIVWGGGGRRGTSVVENGGMMDPTYVLALLGFLDSNFEPLLLFSGDLSVFLERKFQLSRYTYLESGFRLETEILLWMNLGFIPPDLCS